MEAYPGNHRAFCIRAYYRNGDSIVSAQRLYRAEFNVRNAPKDDTIRKWIRMFENTGSSVKMHHPGRPRSVRTQQAIEEVRVSVRQNPSQSVRKRGQGLNIKKSSLHTILKKDLHLTAYKIQLVQELKPTDYPLRLNFANEMLQRFPTFENILFSDEANFHLNGHVNKQNCRFWSNENPREKHERPLHSPKVIVWAAMSGEGLIGPYFFEDQRGRALTVNSERYCVMLRNFLAPQLQEFEGFNAETWFQQDGATCHTSNQSLAVVNQLFPEKVISRRGTINWPPRSPDLTPLDYFMWGYLKQKVYANKPRTLLQLKHNIRTEMAAISGEMCRRVVANFRFRLEECQQSEGQHLDNIIFAN